MKTIPSAMALVAVAAFTFAAGCSSRAAMQPVTPSVTALAADSDGVKCPDDPGKPGGKTVHVDIVYGSGGPKPDPETCYVDSDSTVVWRNPADKASTFNLVFKNSRMANGSAKVAAKKGMDGFKASAKFTGNKDDRFDYTIQVDGKVVDPAVIIK